MGVPRGVARGGRDGRPGRPPEGGDRGDTHAGAARVAHNWALALVCQPVPNPRHLNSGLRRIGRRNRTMARRSGPYDRATKRRREPSNRWRRAQRGVSAAHARVSNLRRDGLHKLTTRIAAGYATVVVEDLHVAGMLRNRRLARQLSDASFGELRRQLDYKTRWHGGRLLVADRWFASSKTCSECGAVRAKLALSERTFTCMSCGVVLDRDDNAARNLTRNGILPQI